MSEEIDEVEIEWKDEREESTGVNLTILKREIIKVHTTKSQLGITTTTHNSKCNNPSPTSTFRSGEKYKKRKKEYHEGKGEGKRYPLHKLRN